MSNHSGINGFQQRPEAIYRCTRDELIARGGAGGRTGGQRRHASAKWQTVTAAVARCQGKPDWSVFADLYDEAYQRGYAAKYNLRKRRAKASAAA